MDGVNLPPDQRYISVDDFEHWSEQLAAKIADLSKDYVIFRAVAEGKSDDPEAVEADPEEARAMATAVANQVLIEIILTLNEIPVLSAALSGGPMPDLIAALGDLRSGRNSTFFTKTPGQKGPNLQSTMMKIRAVACVHTATRAGMIDAEAHSLVAKIFSAAGHRGKKKGPISKTTVFDWCAEITPNHDGKIQQRLLAQALDKMRPSFTRAEAISLIQREARKRL